MDNSQKDDVIEADLTCKNCGATMDARFPKGIQIDAMKSGFVIMQNDEPIEITCVHCGAKKLAWKNAQVRGAAGGIFISGPVSGSNIIIGNGNVVNH